MFFSTLQVGLFLLIIESEIRFKMYIYYSIKIVSLILYYWLSYWIMYKSFDQYKIDRLQTGFYLVPVDDDYNNNIGIFSISIWHGHLIFKSWSRCILGHWVSIFINDSLSRSIDDFFFLLRHSLTHTHIYTYTKLNVNSNSRYNHLHHRLQQRGKFSELEITTNARVHLLLLLLLQRQM